MNKEGAVLAARILTELKEISKLVYRIEQGWKKAKKRKDDFYLDIEYQFYMGAPLSNPMTERNDGIKKLNRKRLNSQFKM